ncbi:MAG TPA: glycosyltransferase family 39 protein [Micromonosporaceae bacterium]|nr:glycosyltransferase family 39 protein [Micromonosporaceae bacterium]
MRATATGTAVRERPTVPDSPRVGERRLLCVVLAVALILRIPPWGASLWIDEGTTYSMISRPWGSMIRLFGEEPNGLLYAILAKPLLVLGDSEWILRLPAVVGGVLAVVALWWAAQELELPRAALPAAALFAVSPLAVKISADARPYPLVVLVACLSVATLARANRASGTRWWLAYVACVVALTYLNALALLIVSIHPLVLLLRRPVRWQPWLASLAAAALASLPMAVLLARDRARRNPLYWLSSDSVGDLAREMAKFFGYHPLLAALELGVVIAAAVVFRRRRGELSAAGHLRHPLIPILGWAALPPLFVFAISQISPMLKDRYFIVALPGACLLVAICLLPWRRPVRAGLLAVILLGSVAVAADRNWRLERMGEDWRAAVRELESMRAPGDPVIFDGADGLAVAGYYSAQFRLADGRAAVTQWDRELPPRVLAFQPPGGYSRVPVGPIPADTLAAEAQRTGRVFVVEMDYDLVGPQSFAGPGAEWARAHCSVDDRVHPRVVLILITACRTG